MKISESIVRPAVREAPWTPEATASSMSHPRAAFQEKSGNARYFWIAA
jgi:hypothetical protein